MSENERKVAELEDRTYTRYLKQIKAIDKLLDWAGESPRRLRKIAPSVESLEKAAQSSVYQYLSLSQASALEGKIAKLSNSALSSAPATYVPPGSN